MSFQKFNKIVEGSFNSQKYIDDYLKYGKFPKIHNQVSYMIKNYANEPEPCFDLGSCTGLLSINAVENGRSFCLGIEGNEFDYKRSVKHPKVKYWNKYITKETLIDFEIKIKEYKPTLIICRRILSEIGYYDVGVVYSLAEIFYRNGVNKIIIQGRVPVKNPQVKLWNTELEAQCFKKYYKVLKKKNSTYLLVKK